jgi:hypothetical protein
MSRDELYALVVAFACYQLGYWSIFVLVRRVPIECMNSPDIYSMLYSRHRMWIFFLMRVLPVTVISIMLPNPLRCLVLLRVTSLTSWMILRRSHIRTKGFTALKAPIRALVIDICVVGLVKVGLHFHSMFAFNH